MKRSRPALTSPPSTAPKFTPRTRSSASTRRLSAAPMSSASSLKRRPSSASSMPCCSNSTTSGSFNIATCRPRPWPNLHRPLPTRFHPNHHRSRVSRGHLSLQPNSTTLTDVTINGWLYLLVFIRNLLMQRSEKILLVKPLSVGGITLFLQRGSEQPPPDRQCGNHQPALRHSPEQDCSPQA